MSTYPVFIQSAWVKVAMMFEDVAQKMWYMACEKCFQATDAMHGTEYTCNECSKKQTTTPR